MKQILFLRPLLLLAVALMASFAVLFISPAPIYADSVKDGLDQLKQGTGNAYPDTAFSDKKTPVEIFGMIINIALGIAFAVAVIMVIYGGYQYITSAGNEEKATSGRQTILYALVGIVIILLSFVIVSAVVTFIRDGKLSSNSNSSNSNSNTGV